MLFRFSGISALIEIKTHCYSHVCFRVALDDKVFQRGLEVALALSVKELPTVTNQVQKSQEKSNSVSVCLSLKVSYSFCKYFLG